MGTRSGCLSGLVPALDIGAKGVGGVVLTQSLAIIEWLDAAYPEPRLIPADPVARAKAMAHTRSLSEKPQQQE